jgi:hypothetical protein
MSTAAQFLPRPAAARKPGRPLAGWPEADVLALIGHRIAPPFPIGSASRWHRPAGSLGEKRIAECVASIIYKATGGDDPLARRVAIAAAAHVAERPPALLCDLIDAAFRAALASLGAERRQVAERVAAIRQQRTRHVLAKTAAQRRAAEAQASALDREAAALKRELFDCLNYGVVMPDGGRIDPADPRFRRATLECLHRDVPKLECRAAVIRAAVPSYRLTKGQRLRLAELSERLRRLRAAQRALRQARRDLHRAKLCQPTRDAA